MIIMNSSNGLKPKSGPQKLKLLQFFYFSPVAELGTLRLWVDAASQNAWDTGKKMISNNFISIQFVHFHLI